MNALGKRSRKKSGMNRHQLRHVNHVHKSAAKRRKMGWGRGRTSKKEAS